MKHSISTETNRLEQETKQTLVQVLFAMAEASPNRVVMRVKRLGIWEEITWKEIEQEVRHIARGLLKLTVTEGESICILSENRPEWVVSDLATMAVGGASAGIYPTCAKEQVEYHIVDSGARIVFVEDERQLDKVLETREQLPNLAKIIVFDMDGLAELDDSMIISYSELFDLGRTAKDQTESLTNRILDRKPEDAAVIVYTSGTTGAPKGAVISHQAIVHQLAEGAEVMGFSDTDERLSYLPLCHAAERVWGVYMGMYTNSVINFVESMETLLEDAQEIQPTVMLAVPRIWEKFHSSITLAVHDAVLSQQLLYALSVSISKRFQVVAKRGGKIPVIYKASYWLARMLVLNNIRRFLGLSRCHLAITGAAPVSPELIEWYHVFGIEMVEGYGQTEASGMISIGRPGNYKIGTVGLPMPSTEIQISERGEILVRSTSNFSGYINQPEATSKTLEDNWLHTGDMGSLDGDGHLKITDRLKDVIITAGGKNISPSEIENKLKFSPYINDAVVVGDRRKYLVALIVIDFDNVANYAQDESIAFTDFRNLCRQPGVVELMEKEVDAVNKQLAQVETVKKFKIIEHSLTSEDEEMTPTMKLKRKYVSQNYNDQIEEMYRN